MKLIVGLGNPGNEYEHTRHNIGFVMIQRFVDENKLGNFSYNNKYSAEVLQTTIDGEKVIFCKPMTYMNLSGQSISQLVNFYKININDIIVLHDEIDFETGRIALKVGGSPAGHNGLKSIIEKIGSPDFARIRIGVDRPANNKLVADWVLSGFKSEEKKILDEKYLEAEKLINDFLK